MKEKTELNIEGIPVRIYSDRAKDYISLTDIAKYRDNKRTNYIIQNWMRNKSTIEFLGLWEKINNPNFKGIEFDAFKNSAGANSFTLTPLQWVTTTLAIGIIIKPGRYHGGIFAHKDIAFEFASWISSEFKLYLITEFQRFKESENRFQKTSWDVSRILSKINYKIHTDAIKQTLIPQEIASSLVNKVYSDEADVLNIALFGQTAKNWRDKNVHITGNIRDYATIEQLVILSNLESINAELIRSGIPQKIRLRKLNQIAIYQMGSILGLTGLKKLN